MTKQKPVTIDFITGLRSVRYLLLAAAVLTLLTILALYTNITEERKLTTCKQERKEIQQNTRMRSVEEE